ncbi:ankyrin repeat domain-containing protein 24-like isoform X2 [Gigantopelta aegis]|uniref:ankyrin repeat domain-containing protein 24-like isoform X2 n=1 Tax=Gigantopelta aegis TaxID=1735272 RepID=UPI001B88CA8A|nr:ankyrin repeat domain-containing protein 24-like isoform X2 [Gigantopelta aegis]
MSKSRMKNLFKFRTKSTTDLSEWNKNDEKLLKSVESGDVKKVSAILAKKTLNPTKLGPRGHNVFHIACAFGNEQIVEILLKYSDDVSDLTIQGTTALQLAAAKGHTNIVQRLLQVNADVDMVDSNNMTALHHACAGLHLQCVQMLLTGQASPQTKEKTGKTPLFYAAHRGDVAICKWLVDKGADVNAADMYQMTPLIVAAKEGHKEVVEFLLKKGAIPDHVDRERRNALMYAMMAGHQSMKEVFAKAPTRASWDVHPSSIKTNAVVVVQDTPSKPEPSADQTNHVEVPPTAEKTSAPEREVMSKPVTLSEADQKTKQALKELEEEHDQLNEEFHKLSLQKMKLQDKVDFLNGRLDHVKQEQSENDQVVQEYEDTVNDLRNLLEEEQERSSELAIQLLHSTDRDKQVILSCSGKGSINTRSHDNAVTTSDSWDDSDEELFDPSAKKQKTKGNADDARMVALLRSQVLAVRQENDQLKEKLQSLPNGLLETSPYILPSEKDTGSLTTDSDELQSLRNRITSMEAEREELKSQVLKAKEGSQFEQLADAINHEGLVVENKSLKEQLEDLKTKLDTSQQQSADSTGHEDLLEENRKLTAELEVMRSKLESVEQQQHAEHERCSSADGDSGDSGISGVKPEGSKTTEAANVAFLQAQNEQLTDQCSLLTDELDKLRTTFDAILKAGDNLQTDYDALQNEKERLQEELERTVQEKEELVKENEFLLSDGNALHDDLKKLVHELEKMQDRLKQVDKEKEASARLTTAVSLSGKVGEFSRLLEERDGLKQQLDELTTEWSRLQHDQEILVEEVQSLQEQVAALSTERDKLQTEADDVETLLQQHDVLQQDYSQLEQDYAELLKEKEKVEQELLDGQGVSVEDATGGGGGDDDVAHDTKDLVRENTNLGYEKEQLDLTVLELSKANALLEEEVGQLQQELDHTQRQRQQQQHGEADVDVTLQSTVIAQKDEQVRSLQEQMTCLQRQLAEFDDNHKDVVGAYRTHLISAVQGHMDSNVKEALHQIIELRSMEQFC